jgi:hypothetical protein
MEKLAVIIVWLCTAAITVVFVAVYVIIAALVLTVTWPWYLYRAGRRAVFPR